MRQKGGEGIFILLPPPGFVASSKPRQRQSSGLDRLPARKLPHFLWPHQQGKEGRGGNGLEAKIPLPPYARARTEAKISLGEFSARFQFFIPPSSSSSLRQSRHADKIRGHLPLVMITLKIGRQSLKEDLVFGEVSCSLSLWEHPTL